MRRSKSVYALGEHLAQWPADAPLPDSVRIADELGVAASTVTEWRRHFRFHRALAPSTRGETVDRPRLLQVLTAHRTARLTPALEQDFLVDARSLSQRLTRDGVPHALAMLSAANEWAFFEPRRTLQLYAPRDAVSTLRDILPEVEVASTGSEPGLQVFTEDFKTLPLAQRGGLPVTNLFFTLLDCRAHPEGGAHAHFLETQLLDRRRP